MAARDRPSGDQRGLKRPVEPGRDATLPGLEIRDLDRDVAVFRAAGDVPPEGESAAVRRPARVDLGPLVLGRGLLGRPPLAGTSRSLDVPP